MARVNPGSLNIATINPGSTQNLAAELFRSVADIKVTIVPFRTSPDMATALLRGDVDVAFEFYAAIRGRSRTTKSLLWLPPAESERRICLPFRPSRKVVSKTLKS
jgi:tripartite-type tricarboxylate transporter receptor subunit TctC